MVANSFSSSFDVANAVLDSHLRLDAAIEQQLQAVISDTNAAALALMESLGRIQELLVDVGEPSEMMAVEIAEILGQIQSQDVVRQRVERIATAVARRNGVLKEWPQKMRLGQTDLTELPQQLLGVLDEYLVTEARHAPGANPAEQASSLPKFELF